jgi:hypothetical protein
MANNEKLTPQQITQKLLDPKAYEEEAHKQAEAKAEKLKKEVAKVKPKVYFDVKVECMVPAVLTYKVLAEDANEAASLIKGKTPNSVQHKLVGRKEQVLKVYDSGSNFMRLKRILG